LKGLGAQLSAARVLQIMVAKRFVAILRCDNARLGEHMIRVSK
jgi:hypothetical protein